MYTIRDFDRTDAGYAAGVTLHNAAWPDDLATVEDWKEWEARRDPKYLNVGVMIDIDVPSDGTGEKTLVAIGGYGESHWSHQPGKYFMEVTVHPDYQGHGIESFFFDTVSARLADRDPKPAKFTADAREDKTEYIDFLKSRGYVQVMRYPVSQLDVTDYDFSRFAGSEERVTSEGIEIHTLTHLMSVDPGWKEKIYELEWALEQDMPYVDPPTKPSMEQFDKKFKSARFRPDGWFIAVDPVNGALDYVGMSTIWADSANTEKVHVGVTGTLNTYRRRGIATALKLRTFVYTQGVGAKYIETDNEENNPMYDLNIALGFKPKPAWVDFEKKLG
ncbi:MAG: hypothetical protein AAF639_41765 [Chloroflexota bacterium]